MLVSVCLEIVLILMQDRSMHCAECTIVSKIDLHAVNGTPRRRGSCGISFQSVWRQCNCRCNIGARFAPFGTIGSEIILNAPDGTPR